MKKMLCSFIILSLIFVFNIILINENMLDYLNVNAESEYSISSSGLSSNSDEYVIYSILSKEKCENLKYRLYELFTASEKSILYNNHIDISDLEILKEDSNYVERFIWEYEFSLIQEGVSPLWSFLI